MFFIQLELNGTWKAEINISLNQLLEIQKYKVGNDYSFV